MIEMQVENERVERLRLQHLGEEWIRAITERATDRLEPFCQPNVISRLLTPRKFITLDNSGDLAAKYREWFGECTDFQVEASRIGRVGERLGILYRFLLRKQGEWHQIEQQVYCTLSDGRVERADLLCSGFQLVGKRDDAAPMSAMGAQEPGPTGNALLEFKADATDSGSTCALLTPALKAKLREMQSGQVLEVRVDDPSAKGDIEAWSRLSGNPLLGVIEDGQALRFFVQKK